MVSLARALELEAQVDRKNAHIDKLTGDLAEAAADRDRYVALSNELKSKLELAELERDHAVEVCAELRNKLDVVSDDRQRLKALATAGADLAIDVASTGIEASKRSDELELRNAELVAQVEALRKAVIEPAMDAAIIYSVKTILNKTPAQCLRQIQAEALDAEADLILAAPDAAQKSGNIWSEHDKKIVFKIGAMIKARAAMLRAKGSQ